MSQEPKTGDRVLVTTRDFEPEYRPGDRGTVLSGPHPIPSGGFFYVVAVDKDGSAATGIVFHAGEIAVDTTACADGSPVEPHPIA
jgi:hypothetical protein